MGLSVGLVNKCHVNVVDEETWTSMQREREREGEKERERERICHKVLSGKGIWSNSAFAVILCDGLDFGWVFHGDCGDSRIWCRQLEPPNLFLSLSFLTDLVWRRPTFLQGTSSPYIILYLCKLNWFNATVSNLQCGMMMLSEAWGWVPGDVKVLWRKLQWARWTWGFVAAAMSSSLRIKFVQQGSKPSGAASSMSCICNGHMLHMDRKSFKL